VRNFSEQNWGDLHERGHWHNPFRCSAFREWPGFTDGVEWSTDQVKAFDEWLSDRPSLVAGCWYHRQGYERAMPLAVRAMRQLAGQSDWGQRTDGTPLSNWEAVEAVLSGEGVDPADVEKAAELVWIPICWLVDTDYLTDGQHRMCALRRAGVTEVVVLAR
jgi:hypothetical protein